MKQINFSTVKTSLAATLIILLPSVTTASNTIEQDDYLNNGSVLNAFVLSSGDKHKENDADRAKKKRSPDRGDHDTDGDDHDDNNDENHNDD